MLVLWPFYPVVPTEKTVCLEKLPGITFRTCCEEDLGVTKKQTLLDSIELYWLVNCLGFP